MGTVFQEERSKARQDAALDIIRIVLGIALLIRGVTWAFDSSLVSTLVSERDAGMLGSGIFIHFAIFAHVVGGLMLTIGWQSRAAAIVQVPVLLGAFSIALRNGQLFSETQSIELTALVFVVLLSVSIFGSGVFSLDHYLYRRTVAARAKARVAIPVIVYAFALLGFVAGIMMMGGRILFQTLTVTEAIGFIAGTMTLATIFLLFYGFGRSKAQKKA